MNGGKAEITATWDISLNCDCPKCAEFVDLLREDNFLDNHERLQPIENGTERANNLEVTCPESADTNSRCAVNTEHSNAAGKALALQCRSPLTVSLGVSSEAKG